MPLIEVAGVNYPLISNDRAFIESFHEQARAMMRRTAMPARLVCFDRSVQLERLTDA